MTNSSTKSLIPSFKLDSKYLLIHKEGISESNFGLDNTTELIEDGFGIYSSAGVREKIGPLKSQFFRIGFCRKGKLEVDFGLETFIHVENTIHFNFPGQLFSMKNASQDMFSYYILFTPEFIEEVIPPMVLQTHYPFLDYAGVPFFQLNETESNEIEKFFFAINQEVKKKQISIGRAIKHFLNLILIIAERSYIRQGYGNKYQNSKASSLVIRFKKLVNQHFISIRSVSDYADKLAVTSKHLSKIVKIETGKTPSDFIDEMLLMEIKALLRHSDLSISEIAYQLDFSDPSHLTNFFKKHKGISPIQYRNQ